MPKITLRAARVNAGYTAKSAAKALDVHPSTILRWEERPHTIKYEDVGKIEKLYNISSDYIFFGK